MADSERNILVSICLLFAGCGMNSPEQGISTLLTKAGDSRHHFKLPEEALREAPLWLS
ncbi:MAG: hypothetical protein ACI91G_001311 [Gammaproteobacteria bacterium]|jgi:hypothetical protein